MRNLANHAGKVWSYTGRQRQSVIHGSAVKSTSTSLFTDKEEPMAE
jgi:hypothetical protein